MPVKSCRASMQRNRPRLRRSLGLGPRSMPNLNEMINVHPRINVAQGGDYRFNIMDDLIPAEQTDYQYNRLKIFLIKSAETGFVAFVLLQVISLLIDPTPLYRALNVFSTTANCENYCTRTHLNDLKTIENKLKNLERQIYTMSKEFSNLTTWRFNLEYHVLNEFSKTKVDTMEYISNLEKKMLNALRLYDADKLGIIDYALESAGGSIISTPDTIPYPSKITYVIMGMIKLYASSSPKLIIQPGTLPGQCFAFHGQTGRVRIKLAQLIKITSVTLEHTHRNLVSDISSCPKDFKVYGLSNIEEENKVMEQTDLGTFTYMMNGTTLQNFKIDRKFVTFEHVELRILRNYGNNEYTCVYRFRVHGKPV